MRQKFAQIGVYVYVEIRMTITMWFKRRSDKIHESGHMIIEMWWSHDHRDVIRFESFVFFSFLKSEAVRNRLLFRGVSIVSRNWKKYENTREKSVSSCFAKLKKSFFSLFCIFSFNLSTFFSIFIPFVRFSYLLFDFRTFY